MATAATEQPPERGHPFGGAQRLTRLVTRSERSRFALTVVACLLIVTGKTCVFVSLLLLIVNKKLAVFLCLLLVGTALVVLGYATYFLLHPTAKRTVVQSRHDRRRYRGGAARQGRYDHRHQHDRVMTGVRQQTTTAAAIADRPPPVYCIPDPILPPPPTYEQATRYQHHSPSLQQQ